MEWAQDSIPQHHRRTQPCLMETSCNCRTHPRPASRREPADATDLLVYSAMLDDPFLGLCYQNVRWFDPTPGRFLEIPIFRSSKPNHVRSQ